MVYTTTSPTDIRPSESLSTLVNVFVASNLASAVTKVSVVSFTLLPSESSPSSLWSLVNCVPVKLLAVTRTEFLTPPLSTAD